MPYLRFLPLLVAVTAFTGCIHIRGVVLQDPTNRPLTTARITVGHPGGIGVFATHDVDSHGRFDFYIGPTDDSDVYIYDTVGGPDDAMHLDRTEISDKMTIRMRAAGPPQPGMMQMSPMP